MKAPDEARNTQCTLLTVWCPPKKKNIKCCCKQNQSDYKIKAEEAILFKVLNFYIREGERFELIAISVVEFVLILHPVKPECMKES